MEKIRSLCTGATLALAASVVLHPSVASAMTIFPDVTSYSSPGHCGIGDAVKAINTGAAVNACPAGDGDNDLILLSPNLTFDISPGLTLSMPMIIEGDGGGVKLSSNGSRSPAINITSSYVGIGNLTVVGTSMTKTVQGIRISSGTVQITDISLDFLRVTGFTDSAISNQGGFLEISYATIDANVNPSTSNGGGLTSSNGGDTQVSNSTFMNNKAPNGGAIRVRGGYVRVWQSTVTNNRATSGNGGGGFARVESGESFAELDFMHATVARNTASGQGGGIFNDPTASISTRINASVIALNTSGSNNVLDDQRGVIRLTTLTFSDGKNKNLFTSLPTPRPPGYDSTLDMINTNPKIGNVANNGGTTQTIALQSGSPAIDAGLNSVPSDPDHHFDMQFTTDQRGYGFPAPKNGKHDLGAFEF